MKTTKILLLVALVTVVTALVGCQPKNDNTQPPTASTNDIAAATNSMNTNSAGGVNK